MRLKYKDINKQNYDINNKVPNYVHDNIKLMIYFLGIKKKVLYNVAQPILHIYYKA